MFEDRLYDNIMEEMMKGFGAEVRTDEGSLAYNACAKQAVKLEEVYADMEDIYDNMLPDRMEREYLIRYAKERGIAYHYAACPVVKGVFSQEIGLGEMLTCGDYDYEVKESLGGFAYALACTTAGVEANTNFGTTLRIMEAAGLRSCCRPGQRTRMWRCSGQGCWGRSRIKPLAGTRRPTGNTLTGFRG